MRKNAVNEITAGQVQVLFGNGFAFVIEQVFGLITKEGNEVCLRHS